MRNISFALTTRQFLDGSKTVTRRLGWKNLKPGTRLMACKKCMGLKPGEQIERLGEIEIVSVRQEPLELGPYIYHGENCIPKNYANGKYEAALEGFPELSWREFTEFFCHEMKVTPETIVTRIEFKRV